MKKAKKWLEEVRQKKNVEFDDLDRIIQRCRVKQAALFPRYTCTKNGSKSVHHFNVQGVPPISLERPHGNREYVPTRYVNFVLDGLDALVVYIEMHMEEEKDALTIEAEAEDQAGPRSH